MLDLLLELPGRSAMKVINTILWFQVQFSFLYGYDHIERSIFYRISVLSICNVIVFSINLGLFLD